MNKTRLILTVGCAWMAAAFGGCVDELGVASEGLTVPVSELQQPHRDDYRAALLANTLAVTGDEDERGDDERYLRVVSDLARILSAYPGVVEAFDFFGYSARTYDQRTRLYVDFVSVEAAQTASRGELASLFEVTQHYGLEVGPVSPGGRRAPFASVAGFHSPETLRRIGDDIVARPEVSRVSWQNLERVFCAFPAESGAVDYYLASNWRTITALALPDIPLVRWIRTEANGATTQLDQFPQDPSLAFRCRQAFTVP